MAGKKKDGLDGYRLDHGGIIYPYIAKSDWNQVYRIEALLTEPVDVQCIVKTLTRLRRKFPSFFVIIEKHKTMYLLKRTCELPEIVPEKTICRSFDLNDKEHPLFRITYKDNRLGMEIFHAVADGGGAIIVFLNIIAEYYRLKGVEIPSDNILFCHGDEYEQADTENSFLKVFAEGGETLSRSEKPAYQYKKGENECPLRLTSFLIPTAPFVEKAKQMEVSVTQLLTAVYTKAFCISAKDDESPKNIKIEVPLDLRKRFNSATLRNFSLYFITSVSSEHADSSIKEIADILKPQFKAGTDIGKLRNDVHTNVSQAEMKLFRVLPNTVKKVLLKLGNSIYGERLFTSPLSNMGKVELPAQLEEHIESIGFCIGKTLKNTVYSTVATYKGNIRWNVTSIASDDTLEKNIARILKEAGVEFSSEVRA